MTRHAITLAKGFSLPVDVVTQTIAILAKRRAGKSYLARRFAEQLFKASQQIVIVDPKGDWWGIRSAANGKGPGLPIVIFGGERGDVPLEPRGGELVAKLIVEDQVSALLDLSLFRKHEVATFMTAFLETLYRLKALEKNRTPVMLFVDEADAIAPQKPQENEARMLGAAEDIVRRGGQRGIGCTLITQRSAVLSKNVLTQAEILIALRTISPQDLKALEAWIDVHGTDTERGTLMESLPALPQGDAWVWSPGWPTKDGIFERIHTLPIETWDSGATPKPGAKPTQPKQLAEVDLAAVRKQMAATIEEAKASDPRALRARIAELEAELKKAQAAKPFLLPKPKRVEVPVLTPKERAQLERALEAFDKGAVIAADGAQRASAIITKALEFLDRPHPTTVVEISPAPIETLHRVVVTSPARVRREPRSKTPVQGEMFPAGARRILGALATFHPKPLTRAQVATLAGVAVRGGTFSTYTSQLKTRGLIEIDGGTMRLVGEGVHHPGGDTPRTQEQVLELWDQHLPAGARAMLRQVVASGAVNRETLGSMVDIAPSGGTFSTYLSKLTRNGLVERRGRDIVPGPALELFA